MKRQLFLYGVLGALIIALYVGIMHHYDVIDKINRNHRIINDSLIKVNETQYKKLIDDRLTKKELKKILDSLGAVSIKNPETIIIKEIEIREVTKTVDKVEVIDGKVVVEDYYPNKKEPFVRYTLKDTVSNFKFYPFNTSIIISENRDGTWQVDSKVPEFMEITNIKAISQPKVKERKRPFIVGAGYTHYKDINVFETSIGVKVKNTIITGTATTDGGYGVKTFYNF